jgi:hypothetical protein
MALVLMTPVGFSDPRRIKKKERFANQDSNGAFANAPYQFCWWCQVFRSDGLPNRMLGTDSYRSAWYMCMRLRADMIDPAFKSVMGIVEIDETFK